MTRLYAAFSSHALLPSPFRGSSLSARISEVRRRSSNNLHNFCCAQFLPPMRRTGARPVVIPMPCATRRMARPLRFPASWGKTTPASFDAAPLGTNPQGRRLFLMLLFALFPLPKVVESLTVTFGTAHSVAQWFNTVVFLPTALRHGTHTQFSCSRCYFSLLTRVCETGSARAQAKDA